MPSTCMMTVRTNALASLEELVSSPLLVALGVVVVGVVGRQYQCIISRRRELNKWIERARQERAAPQQVFEKEKASSVRDGQVLVKDDILDRSVVELAQQLRSKQLNVVDVVTYFCKRCRQHGRREDGANAITEELYDRAIQQAKVLPQKSSKSLPFYGVPISVKECLAVKGRYSTGGLACRLNARMSEDCLIVKIFQNAGALPICLGNTVQTMMLTESVNNIWGRSRNPWDLKRTPGGSSGGDAALVAMRCVPLAIGSDVAGSIRVPAAFCGIVGFKPTSTRLSMNGCMRPKKNNRQGTHLVLPTSPGPLARTVDDCALFMETICVPELWESDLSLPPIPFDRASYEACGGKLKIGYFETDHWFHPSSASKRGVSETIQKLKEAGHECVPFDPPTDGWFNYELLVKINLAEGNIRSYLEALEGEAMIPEFNTLRIAAGLPDLPRWLLRRFLPKRMSFLLDCGRRNGISVYELWQLFADLTEMRKEWALAVQEARVDAVIFPASPLPALPHGVPGKLSASFSYIFIANLLLWPSGVVPVTTVLPDEQHYSFHELPKEQRDDKFSKEAMNVMNNSAGMPMSVSVMSPTFRDETCLRVMKEVERVVCFSEQPKAYLNEKHSS